jgi:tetratricopeptide (TPR) repeat protein
MSTRSRSIRQPAREPDPAALSHDIIGEEDQGRLVRLLRRTLGGGFKLAFVEVADARAREAVLAWLEPLLQSTDAELRRLDIHDQVDSSAGENFNLWGILREHAPPESIGPRELLTLWGFEDVMYRGRTDRSQLLQQINVQRDILVRDYPCWWLLFVHPESRQQWWSVAPDFCDLASIWCEAPKRLDGRREPANRAPQRNAGDFPAQASATSSDGELPALLRLAHEHLTFSRYAEALDAIHSFRAGTARPAVDLAVADMLEASVHLRRGNPDAAVVLLRDSAIPAFERLGQPSLRASAFGRLADVLVLRGEFDEALRIRREEQLPVYEWLGDVHARAVTMGKIADVLQRRGETDEALRIRREEQLPVFERLGDVRSRAVTIGKIADILQRRGETDEALRIRRQEELPVYERLGDVREYAITMGRIADVLEQRGEIDEALRIRREEELPVYERLGDVHSRAVTLGQIADVLHQRGETDEALRIRREEELPVYEQLGDVHEYAVAMGKVADVLQQRGEADEALRIRREEELPVYERLGDVRSRAITMGKIADVLQRRGETDEALRIRREEELPVYERLGDVHSRAVTLTHIARSLRERGDRSSAQTAYEQALQTFERVLGPEHAYTMMVREELGSIG